MGARKRALPFEIVSPEPRIEALAAAPAARPMATPAPPPQRIPALRVTPLLPENPVRRFVRVPTHSVGVYPEHREYPRASLKLPLRLRSIEHVPEDFPVTLVTRDISSSGCFFLCPKELAVGTSIELEIVLVSRPMGRGNVVMASMAHVRRIEAAAVPGWFGVAASFDDVQFDRDDSIPSRYLNR
jgi:PilZ domain